MSEQLSLDQLIAEAELGKEAKEFLAGNLGKWLVGCAEQELKGAQVALENVDPNDVVKVRDLQARAWRARKFAEWLVELVDRGESAIEAYKQQKQEG